MKTKTRKSVGVKGEPIVKEVLLNAPFSKVWKALTRKEEMKQWYFDIAEFKPEPGFEFSFEGGTETKKYLHLCKIKEVVPERKISYTWKYKGYPGISLVTFELYGEGGKTRLKLTHEGIESFGSGNPDFAKENFVQGWSEIIGSSIKKYMEK
ncbi:MAG TPA: SRPBCC family protein [Ignavibacteriaceae bacterium]|nr:SRPBCC family protein [Ignavibacteriaceae bacterium]